MSILCLSAALRSQSSVVFIPLADRRPSNQPKKREKLTMLIIQVIKKLKVKNKICVNCIIQLSLQIVSCLEGLYIYKYKAFECHNC